MLEEAPVTPRVRANRALVADMAWAGFCVQPKAIPLTFDANGRLESAVDACIARIDETNKEVGFIMGEAAADIVIELTSQYVERVKPVLDSRLDHPLLSTVDLGLFFEFARGKSEYAGAPRAANLYLMMFCRNLAEYQAKQMADSVGIKAWVCNRAYYEDGKRLPTEPSKLHFLPTVANYASMMQVGDGWELPGHKEYKAEGWLDRCPGILSLSFANRIVTRELAINRFRDLEGGELLSRAMQFLKARHAAGNTMYETAKMLGVVDHPYELSCNFVLPLKKED